MYVLTAVCPDRPGLLGLLGSLAADCGANVVEAASHVDAPSQTFLARLVLEPADTGTELDTRLADARARWDGTLHASPWPPVPVRAAVLCSRPQHAAAALFTAAFTGELPVEPVAVVSDVDEPRALAERNGVPFVHLPIGEVRAEQEERLAATLSELDVELVVLARYMRVLPAHICATWSGRMINIHHALLPAFPGANPYRRAFDRGVKLVGATAHYVTAELDEGPIIAQDVTRVSYLDGPSEFAARGAAIESQVLIASLRAHLEHRVFVLGPRTVVLG